MYSEDKFTELFYMKDDFLNFFQKKLGQCYLWLFGKNEINKSY